MRATQVCWFETVSNSKTDKIVTGITGKLKKKHNTRQTRIIAPILRFLENGNIYWNLTCSNVSISNPPLSSRKSFPHFYFTPNYPDSPPPIPQLFTPTFSQNILTFNISLIRVCIMWCPCHSLNLFLRFSALCGHQLTSFSLKNSATISHTWSNTSRVGR